MFPLLRFRLRELFRNVFLSSDNLPFRSREGYLLRNIRVVFRGGHFALPHVTGAEAFNSSVGVCFEIDPLVES